VTAKQSGDDVESIRVVALGLTRRAREILLAAGRDGNNGSINPHSSS
jgi:hypothetical protein